MLNDDPETAEVFVVTSPGEAVSFRELGLASELNTRRYFGARQICPKAGRCALIACHEAIEDARGNNRVDRYFVDCDDDCALLIGQDNQSIY